MKIYYKLTDKNMQTHCGYQWELGVTRTVRNGNGPLCSEHWLHVYEHPLIAVLMNPNHANIKQPRMFECRAGRKILRDGQLKCGVKTLTLLREIEMPTLTITQLVEVAIRCAMAVYHESSWMKWANKWLSGADRSAYAADAVARTVANTAAYAAAYTAAYAAADAADAVARTVANTAAYAAAYAADAADAAHIDLFAILEQVVGKQEVEA